MKKSLLPLFVYPSVTKEDTTIFYTIDEKIVVNAPIELIERLISLCDGTLESNAVVEELSDEWDSKSVRGLLSALYHRGVVVDSRKIIERFWQTAQNPSRFPHGITDDVAARLSQKAHDRHVRNAPEKTYQAQESILASLLTQRKSTRSFSGESVNFQTVVDMLWNTYGALESEETGIRRTVPSAGALYPLVIHIALFKKTGNLEPGIYSVYLGKENSVGFNLKSSNYLRFSRSFLDPLMLKEAHGTVVLSGSFRVAEEKYGNRSVLYVSLEAGHAAQNLHLAAVKNNVATVEIGGFSDTLLAEAIGLSSVYHPLTTIAFGRESEKGSSEDADSAVEVRWNIPAKSSYRPCFAIASARVSEERSWSHGRDPSPSFAYTKAVSEAKEWAACGCIHDNLVKGRFRDIDSAIDPRSIISFHPDQYRLKRFPFAPFNKEKEYEWVKVYNEETGESARVLADLIYFPYFPERPYYAYANSSGVAAHPNRQQAVETSVLELIERDSFMIAHLTQLFFPTIATETLPAAIRERVKALEEVGFSVWVKDHSTDLAPSVCVLAQNTELAYTTCASCASFNAEHAISHALMEVEAAVLSRLENGAPQSIHPEEVMWPRDHGALYAQEEYFHMADFLIRGQEKVAFEDVGRGTAQTWDDLLSRFRAKGWQFFTVPLYLSDEYGGNGDLHIIRSLIPGLVPMTFGFRHEPGGVERIYAVARELYGRKLSYQDLTKFPHPFA